MATVVTFTLMTAKSMYCLDLEVVEQMGAEIGLKLNSQKSEIICINPDIKDSILFFFPGVCEVDPMKATLLAMRTSPSPCYAW